MCRLFGFRATSPTQVECGLVHAPNSLLAQSRRDLHGFENADGWGIVAYGGGHELVVARRPDAAHDGRRFRAAAGRTEAATVLAHVRRATVGAVALENTHPFTHERWSLVHNGTVPYFETIRTEVLAAMSPAHRTAIRGRTDSEHLFHLILSRIEEEPGAPLLDVVAGVLRRVLNWCREVGQEPHLGLNVLLTDGVRMVGSRWQRTLHYFEHDRLAVCAVCGGRHARCAADDYRALTIASEPLTAGPWREVPERSVFEVTPDLHLRFAPLEA